MLLLFWNGSGTPASGAVKISPVKASVNVGGGSVAIKPVTGKAGLG